MRVVVTLLLIITALAFGSGAAAFATKTTGAVNKNNHHAPQETCPRTLLKPDTAIQGHTTKRFERALVRTVMDDINSEIFVPVYKALSRFHERCKAILQELERVKIQTEQQRYRARRQP